MPFSQNWIEGEPDGTITTVSQLDNWIRNTKIAIRERLEASIFAVGTFASGPQLVFRPGVFGVKIRDAGDTIDLVTINSSGILLGGSGLNNARIHALDTSSADRQIMGYFDNRPYGGVEFIDVGSAGSLPICIWAALHSQMPSATINNQGILLINREDNSLCYYSGNNRYKLFGAAF